jgi:hypothetical protein
MLNAMTDKPTDSEILEAIKDLLLENTEEQNTAENKIELGIRDAYWTVFKKELDGTLRICKDNKTDKPFMYKYPSTARKKQRELFKSDPTTVYAVHRITQWSYNK